MSLELINTLLSTLNLLIHALIISYVVIYFIKKDLLKKIISYINEYAIPAAFIISLVAMISSLYYSNIVGFEPCTLCWYQRIFIYPQVVLLGVAWYKKDDKIIPYSLALAVVGSLISAYHYVVQRITDFSPQVDFATPCTIGGSCTSKFVFEYGYITIPMMALTVGVSIIFLLFVKKINLKN